MPLPLIPLAGLLAPIIGRWLGNEEVVKEAVGVVQEIFGTTDQVAVDAKIAANPEMYVQLQVRLAQIAADREAAERQAELDAFKTEVQDRMDARARDVAITAAGRSNIRAHIMVAGAFLTLLGCLAAIVLSAWKTWALTGEVIAMVTGIAGTCGTLLAIAFNFEFGTSRGSQTKDATIAKLAGNGH